MLLIWILLLLKFFFSIIILFFYIGTLEPGGFSSGSGFIVHSSTSAPSEARLQSHDSRTQKSRSRFTTSRGSVKISRGVVIKSVNLICIFERVYWCWSTSTRTGEQDFSNYRKNNSSLYSKMLVFTLFF